MPITLQEERFISAGANPRMVAVSFAKWLDGLLIGSPVLTGTPTVVEVSSWDEDSPLDAKGNPVETVTTDLTLENKAVSVIEHVIDDRRVPAGEAVQFSVAVPADKKGRNYRVRITATSNGSPAESEPMDVILRCV